MASYCKFKLPRHYRYRHASFKGISFNNRWCCINNGVITVYKNYAWDGCTPKFSIFGLFVVGTPDGVLLYGKPWTYHASLLHDVLVQFRADIPLSKRQVTQVFDDKLRESRWPLRRPYVWAVDRFGPQDFSV